MERQGGSTEPLQRHAGVGLKLVHAGQIISEHPPIACFEVHPENFMVEGGPRLAALDSIRAQYPVSLHGVALSLGGTERLERGALDCTPQRVDARRCARARRAVLHAGGEEGGAPPALVVLRKLDVVVALAVHPDHDVADATPAVEQAMEGGEGGMAWCGVEGSEAESGMEEAAARIRHSLTL